VALAGMSNNSFKGTSSIIIPKDNELKNKFKEIYLVDYSSYSNMQKTACTIRDNLKKEKENVSNEELYEPEYTMNNIIANHIHSIILSLGLTNVHLLGKCNGAWIVTLLLLRLDVYKGLYLAVPGIPPISTGIEILKTLSPERLKDINFVFGWTQQDAFPFDWKALSFNEKTRYDEIIEIMKPLKYKSYMYDNGEITDPKIYHELHPNMIDDIIKTLP
jgi:pimeloyl-ACP methyl ester carboxylesterase